MIYTHQQLKEIVAAGGGVVVDAATMTTAQLRELSAAAGTGSGRLTIKNCSGLTAAQLGDLAGLAPGRVEFDLTS